MQEALQTKVSAIDGDRFWGDVGRQASSLRSIARFNSRGFMRGGANAALESMGVLTQRRGESQRIAEDFNAKARRRKDAKNLDLVKDANRVPNISLRPLCASPRLCVKNPSRLRISAPSRLIPHPIHHRHRADAHRAHPPQQRYHRLLMIRQAIRIEPLPNRSVARFLFFVLV